MSKTPTLSKDTRRGPGARRRVLVVVRPPLAGIVAGGSNLKSTQLLGIGVDLDIKSSFGAVTKWFLTCSGNFIDFVGQEAGPPDSAAATAPRPYFAQRPTAPALDAGQQ